MLHHFRLGLLVFGLWLACRAPATAYSVLSHEAIVDASWDRYLQPLLLVRFPTAMEDELRKAHAFAYGGCIIQDLGYYPFGSRLFSELAHYVRSGEFIQALIRESRDLDEYAFALGALAHYAADNDGHRLAVNRAVAMQYPGLRKKYGDVVTYAQNPAAHIKTEFGFDVVQVANYKYAPQAYHDFIGFEVAKPALARAFFNTYGLKLEDVFGDLDLALGTYRRSVSRIIPAMTKAAWAAKNQEIISVAPGATRRKFVYILSRSSYEKEWGTRYDRPGFVSRLLAFLFGLIPKVGPFRAFAFRPPTHETELLFMKSFNTTFDGYRALLEDVKLHRLRLENANLDVGMPTHASGYILADNAYATLLDKLATGHFIGITPQLRADILDYYADLSLPIATKKHRDSWRKTLEELETLKLTMPAAAAGTP